MPKSTLTSKGQVTIPKEVRDKLALKEGDCLVFRFDEQGRLVLEPEAEGPLGNLPGLLHHLAGERPVTVEEMNEGISDYLIGSRAQAQGARTTWTFDRGLRDHPGFSLLG